jgi:hypothetical protein
MPRNDRNRIEYNGWLLEPLRNQDHPVEFDCGDDDLNEFFTQDVVEHDLELLTKTYALTPIGATISEGNKPVALVAFCNDAIRQEMVVERASKTFWKTLSKALPHPKRYDVFPAVKIARLGVSKNYQRSGAGTTILNITKQLFLTNNRTGCRFITVDAYINECAIALYKKNHFQFFGVKDETHSKSILEQFAAKTPKKIETIPMFFDLARHQVGNDHSETLTHADNKNNTRNIILIR